MRIKLSSGKLTVNSNEYKIPNEVAEVIIWLMSTKEDLLATNDIYKKKIDKAIEYIRAEKNKCEKNHVIPAIYDFNKLLSILEDKEETDTNVGEVEE